MNWLAEAAERAVAKSWAMAEERDDKIARLYRGGEITVTDLCRRFGIGVNTLYSILDKKNVPRRGQRGSSSRYHSSTWEVRL